MYHHLGCSAFAEYATVSRRSVVRIDPSLPWDIAALFRCAVITGAGAVVNTASLGSFVATRKLGPYTASKHAVMGLTKTAALEVARKGIRVNAVCPGPVDTDMLRDIEASQAGESAEQLRAQRTASIPDGRYAEPAEVANLMIYLASDLASHITGQGVQINGGSHY